MARNLTRERVDVPLHFENIRLRRGIEATGWLAAVVLTTVGIGLAVSTGGWMVEALGVVTAGCAGVAMVGLVRCRRFETVVNRRFVSGRAGPLVNRLPLGMVEETAVRGATAWRRLYCHREVVLRGPGGVQTLVLPSRDPEAKKKREIRMRFRLSRFIMDYGTRRFLRAPRSGPLLKPFN